MRRPACHPRLKLGPQVAAYVQITCARPAEQPFHGAAGGEIETKLANIQWNSARRLVNVGDHFGAYLVGAARDRRKILNVGTAEADVRHRDECGLSVNRCQQLVQRHGNAVLGGYGNQARAGSLVNIEVRGEIHFLGNDLVSLVAPIEAGQHDRLADGYVLLHHHLAGSGANDLADEIADRDRHLPPAFFPGSYSSGIPFVGVLLQAIARAPGHRSERVADHIYRALENREFFSPPE